jgi:hypothetical protein
MDDARRREVERRACCGMRAAFPDGVIRCRASIFMASIVGGVSMVAH